ncbi:MAG: 6-pyruvoyl trahydropterin synthase family protein [Planctomycetota bacterium]
MFSVSVQTHFWASHSLTLPDGSKEMPHNHNWAVTANVSSGELNPMGIVMDFRMLKGIINTLVADFDNTPLENVDYFKKNNPSAENLAKYIYEKMRAMLPNNLELENIRIVEQPGCMAIFGKQPNPLVNFQV